MLTDRFVKAVDYARVVHAGVTRKSTSIPYLAHVLAVSALVLEHGGSEDQAIAALLHDAAEDGGGQVRLDDIRVEFGPAVAGMVEACSDSLVADPNQKESWWVRKVRYLGGLEHEPPDAALISAADKLHNASAVLMDYRRVGEDLWSRFNADAGRAGALWYYRSMAEVLSRRLRGAGAGPAALADELTRTVAELLAAVGAVVGADVLETDWRASCQRADCLR